MAFNKNIPTKGGGEPDKNQPVSSDANDIDWMILSDITTRIGGSLDKKSPSNPSASPKNIKPPSSDDSDLEDLEWLQSIGSDTPIERSPSVKNTLSDDNDLEDLEWLQSLGLDAAIERSPSVRNTSSTINDRTQIENIDWLIVSDVQTRIDDSEIKGRVNPSSAKTPPPQPNIVDDLDVNLDLGEFDFLEGGDFSDLNSLSFDASDSPIDNIDSKVVDDDLQSQIDVTNGEINDLTSFLGNDFNLNFDENDGGWEDFTGDLADSASETVAPDFAANLVEDLLVDDLELSSQSDDRQVEIDDFAVQDDFLNEVQNSQIASLPSSNLEDEIWSSNSSATVSPITEQSFDDPFAGDWGGGEGNASNDSVWDIPLSMDADILSSTSIENVFDEVNDVEAGLIQLPQDEIGNDSTWDVESTEQSDLESQLAVDNHEPSWEVDLESQLAVDNQEPSWEVDLESQLAVDNQEPSWEVDLESQLAVDNHESSWDTDLETEITARKDVKPSVVLEPQIDDNNDADWDIELNAQISHNNDPSWDIDLESSINYESEVIKPYGDDRQVVIPPISVSNEALSPTTNFDLPLPTNAEDDLQKMLDDDFDLAAFDQDILPEIPLYDFNLTSIATTLTPKQSEASTYKEDISVAEVPIEEFLDAIDLDAIDLDNEDPYLAPPLTLNAPFENSLGNLAPNVPTPVFTKEFAFPAPPNLGMANKSTVDKSDRDFLDEFDLDSIAPITDDEFESSFDSGFISAPTVTTGLTPPPTPIPLPTPPSPPLSIKSEPTNPSLGSPPPLPFLPPLPPKRTSPISHSTNLNQTQTQPQGNIRQRRDEEFDQFHSQSNQPIADIDKGWADLLDSETVVSGERPSTGNFRADSTNTKSMNLGAARNSEGRNGLENRGRNSAGLPAKKESNLPDFNDLGLEIHADDADWSNLLDSGDLSDSITMLSSPDLHAPPSKNRNNSPMNPVRADMSGASETREIPRDRRKPAASFGDSTQARMGTPPNQVDFNRFTENDYDDYAEYQQSIQSPVEDVKNKKPKLTIPSVSLESLWQDYLKIPVIGLGAIGGVFVLYALLNRPVFDLGLRWGLFKDASNKDFSNADFKGVKLDNVNFSKSILTGAKMQDTSLVGANFQEANLDGVNFTNANLSRARLIKSSVVWAEFKNAKMDLVDFAEADLTLSNFAGAKMEGANFKDSKIGAQGTDKATKLSSTNLLAWQIVNQPKEGRNLIDQDLSGLNLSFAVLKRANLSNAKLNYTDMTNTDLSGANLTDVQVNGVNWSGTKLNGVNLTGVNFDKNKLPKTDEETTCPNGKKGPCKF